jgi:hypothetical protein
MLEAEGFEQQGNSVALLQRDEILDAGSQRVGPQVAGVDVMAHRGQHLQRLALALDGLLQRHVALRQRVAPPRFGKALDQHLVARVEEHEARRDAVHFQLAQLRRQGRDARSAAHIHRHGGALVAFQAQVADQVRQQAAPAGYRRSNSRNPRAR